ncbi:hypothetical protein GCM10010381_54170 [Streptomyces xantholiticus]|nr:hypothetical protein GCM10010381_54170 [Streptomyces xantholiticus]
MTPPMSRRTAFSDFPVRREVEGAWAGARAETEGAADAACGSGVEEGAREGAETEMTKAKEAATEIVPHITFDVVSLSISSLPFRLSARLTDV